MNSPITTVLVLFFTAVSGRALEAVQEIEGYRLETESTHFPESNVEYLHYFKGDTKVLTSIVKSSNDGTTLNSVMKFGTCTMSYVDEKDKQISGNSVRLKEGASAFGWWNSKGKTLFEALFSVNLRNFATRTDGGNFSPLNPDNLKQLEEKGFNAVLERLLGKPLVQRKGILANRKLYVRANVVRCQEEEFETRQEVFEKRYTFYGFLDGVQCKFGEWWIDGESGLSCIDCQSGLGEMTFRDRNFDGKFELLEVKINSAKQPIEVFDISDPWHIELIDETQLKQEVAEHRRGEKLVKDVGEAFSNSFPSREEFRQKAEKLKSSKTLPKD